MQYLVPLLPLLQFLLSEKSSEMSLMAKVSKNALFATATF